MSLKKFETNYLRKYGITLSDQKSEETKIIHNLPPKYQSSNEVITFEIPKTDTTNPFLLEEQNERIEGIITSDDNLFQEGSLLTIFNKNNNKKGQITFSDKIGEEITNYLKNFIYLDKLIESITNNNKLKSQEKRALHILFSNDANKKKIITKLTENIPNILIIWCMVEKICNIYPSNKYLSKLKKKYPDFKPDLIIVYKFTDISNFINNNMFYEYDLLGVNDIKTEGGQVGYSGFNIYHTSNYHQLQKNSNNGTAMYALNNLLGGPFFIKGNEKDVSINYFNEITFPINLSLVCNILKNKKFKIECGEENYDFLVIASALKLLGFIFSLETTEDAVRFENKDPNIVGYLINFKDNPHLWCALQKKILKSDDTPSYRIIMPVEDLNIKKDGNDNNDESVYNLNTLPNYPSTSKLNEFVKLKDFLENFRNIDNVFLIKYTGYLINPLRKMSEDEYLGNEN